MLKKEEGNVLFNDARNTFYLQLFGFGHMVIIPSETAQYYKPECPVVCVYKS